MIVKSEKYETFLCIQPFIWRKKWVTRTRQLALRSLTGRVIVVI